MNKKWDSSKLKELMDLAQISQRDLARKIGIKETQLKNYIGMYAAPTVNTLMAMADFFMVPTDYILGRTNLTELEEHDIKMLLANFYNLARRNSYEQYLYSQKVPRNKNKTIEIPDGFIAPYPYNLLDVIFNGSDYLNGNSMLTNDQEQGLANALQMLSQRERDCIICYYQNNETYDEIAKKFHVTRERIRQIIAKAVRKMRHSSRSALILYGYNGCQRKKEIELFEKEYEEYIKRKTQLINSKDVDVNEINLYLESIDELELSVRSRNCLIRKGIHTIDDLLCYLDSRPGKSHLEQLQNIRNLGRKSINEIALKVKEKIGINILEESK